MSDDLRLSKPGELAHVYSEIRGERARQDAKWGGPEHDSQHRPVDWFRYIVEHATLALEALHTSDQPAAEYRRRMIEVAALAVAAIEAEDRAALQEVDSMSDDLRLDEPGELAAHLADGGDVDEPFCYTCVSSAYWMVCEDCNGDGLVEDDEDDGWSIHYDFSDCHVCHGRGGWWECLGTERHDLDPGSIHRIPLEQRAAQEGGQA